MDGTVTYYLGRPEQPNLGETMRAIKVACEGIAEVWRKIVRAARRMARSIHRQAHRRRLERGSCTRQSLARCARCNPASNPPPLAVRYRGGRRR